MGRATKWFRAIFGLSNQQHPNHKAKKWIFGKKSKQSTDFHHKESTRNDVVEKYDRHEVDEEEENRHAIAVSAAAVVKITSVGATVRRSGAGYGESANVSREDWAAVVVQSHFRGYLARRALRALRGLVKLQALARGHLVRKQTAYALRRLQALIRAQDEIRSVRVHMMSESPHSRRKSSPFTYTGPTTPENSERAVRARNAIKNERLSSLKRNGSKLNSDFSHSQQKPHSSRSRTHDNRNGERTSQRRSLTADSGPTLKHTLSKRAHSSHLSLSTDQCCQSFSTSKESIAHQSVLSPSSAEAQSLSRNCNVEEATFCAAADNSPRFCSSSSIGGNSSICRRERHNTPTQSDGTRSCFSNYSDHPSYMAYTESSKAKVRSLSVPKQRLMQHETSSSASRYSRSNTKRSTNLHANDAYMGSGRLDVLGMPVRSDRTRFSGSLWHRY